MSNIHSRHMLSHLGPSFATHPASIERLPWEYPSHQLNIKQCHAQFPGRPRTIGMRQFRTPSPPLSPPSPVPLVPRLKGRLSSQPSLLSSPSEEYLVPGPLPSRLLSLNQRADGGVRRFLHVPELRGDPHPWTAQWRDPGDRCKRAERALIRVSPRRSCRAPS